MIPCVGQFYEIRVGLFVQQVVEGLQPGLLEEHLAHLILAGAHHRVDAHRLEIVAQHLLTEGVDGGNLGGFQLVQRASEGLGVGGGLLDQPLVEALAHFRRRGFGEGHDQHAVQMKPAADKLHDALDKHSGLAGSRRRAHEDGVILCIDGLQLLGRPHGHGTASFRTPILPQCRRLGKCFT